MQQPQIDYACVVSDVNGLIDIKQISSTSGKSEPLNIVTGSYRQSLDPFFKIKWGCHASKSSDRSPILLAIVVEKMIDVKKCCGVIISPGIQLGQTFKSWVGLDNTL